MTNNPGIILHLVTIATIALLSTPLVAAACPSLCQCEETKKMVNCTLPTTGTFPNVPNWTQQLIIQGADNSNSITILGTVTSNDLQNLEQLTELTLKNLGIQSLQADTFSKSANLKRLNLHRNKLTTLPVGVFNNLLKVEYLDLSYNQLTTLTNNELNFPVLIVLDLKGNSIQLRDAQIFDKLPNLHVLDISDNAVGDPIPKYTVPTNLGVVTMKNCSIKTLTNDFRNFVKAAIKIDLQNNEITTLPSNFFAELYKLQELYLDFNAIENVANMTFKDVRADTVSLSNNRISNMESAAFEGLVVTRLLKLNNNNLTSLPPRLFQASGADLKRLYLDDNPLKALGDETFYNLKGLTKLSLRNTQLQTISNSAFSNAKIKELILSENNLKFLSNATLQTFSSVESINLTKNEWNCTEDLVPLRQWLLDNNQSVICDEVSHCLTCSTPDRYTGQSVKNLTENELLTAMDPLTTQPIPTTTAPPTTEMTSHKPVVTSPLPSSSQPVVAGKIGPNIMLVLFIVSGCACGLLFLVFLCFLAKTCYHCREVSYPIGKREAESGYHPDMPDTPSKETPAVQLEHVFTIDGHTNPGFKFHDDELEDLTISTTSLTSTFRRPGQDPCRDSGIVGDSPGSDQSINRPIQTWQNGGTPGLGYENRTYSNLDELT